MQTYSQGGFPCQDISVAGNGEGITGERSGLWGEYDRIIGEINPRYVVIENSPQLLRKGFEKVLYDLSERGYDVEWKCLSASDFGAPHKRERVYVVAYSRSLIGALPVFTWNNGKEVQRNRQTQIRGANRVFLEMAPYISSLSGKWMDKPDPNRMDDGVSNWSYRLKGCGNAVMPDIAHYLFECIKEFDKK